MANERKHEAQGFEQHGQAGRTSLVREFWDFLCFNKKWWLVPILVSFLLLAGLLVAANISSVSPFIYALF